MLKAFKATKFKEFAQKYIFCHKLLLSGALIFLLLAASLTLLLPAAVGYAMDYIFKLSSAEIFKYFFLFVAIILLWSFTSVMRSFFVSSLGEAVVFSLQQDLFKKLLALPITSYDKQHSGDMVSLISSDSALIKANIAIRFSIILRNLIMGIGAFVMMFITNAKLSLVVSICVPLVFFILIGVGKGISKKTRLVQDHLAEMNIYATEHLSAIRTVKAFGAEAQSFNFFNNLTRKTFFLSKKAILARSILFGVIMAVVFLSILITLWLGALDVINGNMTSGEFSKFVMFALLAGSASAQLSGTGSALMELSGAIDRIWAVMSFTPLEKIDKDNDKNEQKIVKGNIAFKNVSFHYPSRPDHPVLKDISFNIKAGQTVAFVGVSGSGKTTIFSLLQQFYSPTEGKILFDNEKLTEDNKAWSRAQLSVVSQHVDIFSGTIAENISFGLDNVKMEDIERAAKLSYAHEFIEKLPNNYHETIGEKGFSLSGGQRQRIAIARALLRQSPILLLDEATSALDATNEELIQCALDNLSQDRTTCIIAHRLSTVLKADKIFVMDDGNIVEEGTHDSLMKKDGIYAQLAKLQFTRFNNDEILGGSS